MFVPDEMRIIRFKDVNIPSNRDYFARLAGAKIELPDSCFTGDEFARMPANPVDDLADYMRYAEKMANESGE